jgi:hypothetical protein
MYIACGVIDTAYIIKFLNNACRAIDTAYIIKFLNNACRAIDTACTVHAVSLAPHAKYGMTSHAQTTNDSIGNGRL